MASVAEISSETTRPARDRVLMAVNLGLLLLLIPFTAYYVARLFHPQSISFNEGWNVYHSARLLAGEALYPTLASPPRPMNYPPMSFLLIGLLQPLTGSLLLTGRLLSLLSLLTVAVLVWSIVARIATARASAWLAALVWMALVAVFGGEYFGTDDPQMMGHVLSTSALLLYVRRQERLDLRSLALMALLCSLAVFVKTLLIAVALTIAVALLLRDRLHFALFTASGVLISGLLGLATYAYAGPPIIGHTIGFEWARQKEGPPCGRWILLDSGLGGLLGAFVLVAARRRRDWAFAPLYFACALASGCFAVRGAVDLNAWFDLFIAGSILLGLVADLAFRKLPPNTGPDRAGRSPAAGLFRHAAWIVLALSAWPFILNVPQQLPNVVDYAALKRHEREFKKNAELLRSIPGPALVEDPLLAMAGNKDVYDLFAYAELAAAGRIPEAVLIEPIRHERFGAIVLYYDLAQRLSKLEEKGRRASTTRQVGVVIGGRALGGRWTLNALRAAAEHYKLLTSDSSSYFYVPASRKGSVGPAGVTPGPSH